MYVRRRCVRCIVWTWIFQVHKYTVNTLRRCISSDDFQLPGTIRFSTHPAGQQAQLPLYQPPCVTFALIAIISRPAGTEESALRFLPPKLKNKQTKNPKTKYPTFKQILLSRSFYSSCIQLLAVATGCLQDTIRSSQAVFALYWHTHRWWKTEIPSSVCVSTCGKSDSVYLNSNFLIWKSGIPHDSHNSLEDQTWCHWTLPWEG